jgi:thiaminase/transcriptional activator TenA
MVDLLVALAPCVLGYGEIGARLLAAPGLALARNPYREWIELYGGEDYQSVARDACAQLDRVAEKRIGGDVSRSGRWDALCRTFATATRLEAGFWDMGWTLER